MESTDANVGISHYRVVRKIGAGGMGEVYLAEDTQLGRRVAIKLLRPETVSDEHARKRLVREARAAATLDHPNICSIYEVGEADDRSFIAMQYIEGETLDARIKSKPLELKESLTIAAQIADALAEAHSHGIIHRDIKPSNIMITSRGQAKVMDFGLARVIAGPVDSEAETQSLLTSAGTIVGTVPYMSPEQVRGEALDGRSDIFSFGVVLYEMLSGRQPFASGSAAATISAILNDEPPVLLRYAPDLPEELQRIARKCLEKDRERRCQTMRDVAIDLDNCRREHEIVQATASQRDQATGVEAVVAPAPDLKRPTFLSSRRALMTSALLALLVVALAYVLVFRRSATTERPREIKSLAVLPLKSLDAGENYLGLGIADAVIRRVNQTGKLIVRPTSAVRRYLNEETDALTAARQLNADAVLEGSVQRGDDRLRVSVNLLCTSDGASLWVDNFDMQMTDIFTIQDTVAQQVASRLRLQLDPSQQARLTKQYTSSTIAYEVYLKGVYTLDQRVSLAKPQWETTVGFFKQAIEADPNFALAHAQLAYAYALKAVFVEPTEPVWAERAKEEINRAQTLDPQLAETHLARFQLLFSAYEGYQGEAAVREVLLAQQLNPNVGHGELAYLYLHLGLEDFGARELQRAFEVDPTSEFAKSMTLLLYEVGCKYDEYAAHRDRYHDDDMEVVYLMGTGRLNEAQEAIDKWSAKNPDDVVLPARKAVLSALKGDFRAAEAAIPPILSRHPVKDPFYHHAAYDIARIYALEGKSVETVKWLREANASGFQCYPLFERDAYLNRIRQAPEFIQFMAEMKAQNERYRREFGEAATR
jgi:TolB-like protein/tRNA A-37 threonylcarbamoyl transferase component Bud32